MSGLIYIHVPKCGGTSFGSALRLRYITSQATIKLNQGDRSLAGEARILSDYCARRNQLYHHVARGVRLITGHVQYDPTLHRNMVNQYGFITLLRDPVARFVSHYHYLQRKHPDPARPNTLDAFLETRDAQRLATQYLFYFAGKSQLGVTDTTPLVKKAVTALSRFDFVGDLTDPENCIIQLRKLTAGHLPYWHRNRAPEISQPAARLRPRLEALCMPDLEVFESVRDQRIAA